jgi:hypothetical protein
MITEQRRNRLLQELPCHHYALDLVGTFVDLGVVGRGFSRAVGMFVIMWLAWAIRR